MNNIKGPWKFIMVEAEYNFYDVVDQDGAVVLKKGNYDEYSEASIAQGHLIAAAPELLDILEDLVGVIGGTTFRYNSLTIKARKIISKARGKL